MTMSRTTDDAKDFLFMMSNHSLASLDCRICTSDVQRNSRILDKIDVFSCCNICSEKFATFDETEDHYNKMHECYLGCDVKFQDDRAKHEHLMKNHSKCTICNEFHNDIEDHMTKKHFTCIFCYHTSSSVVSTKEHIIRAHKNNCIYPEKKTETELLRKEPEMIKCPLCRKMIGTSSENEEHLRKTHTCFLCNQQFAALGLHERNVHSTCNVCKIKCENAEETEIHFKKFHLCPYGCVRIFTDMSRHIDEDHRCSKCQCLFENMNRTSRLKHLKNEHSDLCTFCDKEFADKAAFEKHWIDQHTCKLCNSDLFFFENQTQKKIHNATYHEKCNECLEILKSKDDKIQHYNTEHSMCINCSKLFAYGVFSKDRHFVDTHSCHYCKDAYDYWKMKHQCSECDINFKRSYERDKHIWHDHTKCPVCGKRFENGIQTESHHFDDHLCQFCHGETFKDFEEKRKHQLYWHYCVKCSGMFKSNLSHRKVSTHSS